MSEPPVIYVVDDDYCVRRAITRLLDVLEHRIEVFEDADSFLAALPSEPFGFTIIVLDMPGMNGQELQRQLTTLCDVLPVIFLTGRGSIATCAEALKAGALDFLEKPADATVLREVVLQAIDHNAKAISHARLLAEAVALLGRLTEREQEVFRLVARGFSNREVGTMLGLATETVKVHRARVMRKVEADSLADLVMLAHLTE